jgi:hypothetical protein
MASEVFNYRTPLAPIPGPAPPGVYYPQGSTPLTVTISAPSAFIAPGDPVTVSYDGIAPFTGVYAGTAGVSAAAGSIVVDYGGTHYVFSFVPENGGVYTINGGGHTLCFLAGTMIATPTGERAIETLEPGDLVLTHDGRAEPVKWLFVQTVSTVFADAARVAPVRIAAGALGDGLPARDLWVSADHALLLDGVLVQAGALVNGATIQRASDLPDIFTYHHVELADHALILAEGVPAETFLDSASRRTFDNWQAYEAVHGADTRMVELDLPRIKSARQVRRAA